MSVLTKLRAVRALAGASCREATADPASSLLLMTAVAAVHLAPAFQFHRLGEPGRLARDGGLSALLVFGGVFASVAAVKTERDPPAFPEQSKKRAAFRGRPPQKDG